MEKLAIGIDLGGTNLKGIVMGSDGEGRHVTRVPTEAQKGGQQVLQNILTLVDLLVQKVHGEAEILGVGLGSPGFIDKDGTVLGGAENLPGWKGTQIYAPIMERFGLRTTAANDVTVAALAELKYGAGKGVDNLVCFALGTGIGGGIAINGRLYKGTHGMAGELGHIVVETDGVQCNCGQRGCVERYASATGIVRLAREYAAGAAEGEKTPFVRLVNEKPSEVTSKMVYDYVAEKDPVALKVHETACEMLGRAVGITLNALAPDRVVLGGGVMMAGEVILEGVSRHGSRYCWPAIFERCDIVSAQMGEDAGVMGAAGMVFEELG